MKTDLTEHRSYLCDYHATCVQILWNKTLQSLIITTHH